MSAESQNKYDAAYEAYKKAFVLKPQDAKYIAAYLHARTTAAIEHIKNGQKLAENSKLDEAAAEFQRAMEIDATNFVASEELQRVTILMKRNKTAAVANVPNPEARSGRQAEDIEGPLELEPSPNAPISLRMTTTADNVYRTIGKIGGINVLFDLDYKPQKINVELNDVQLEDALKMVAMESKTFWRPISSTAIFVAAEGKRKELEPNVMETFYLQNLSGPTDLQEVVGALKGMLDITRIQVNAIHSSITMRATPDQLVLAEKLISEYDKPKSEVVIDIAVMQISKDRMRTLGTTMPTSATFGPLGSTGASGSVILGSLAGNSLGTSIPSATFTALLSDSDTKVLQSPEIRALNDQKAILRIGDRVPIATGSFSPVVGGGVNTQFQYLDVGVNIDITPHVHSEHEVTLKMALEISTVTGSTNIGGISQPTIGQRRIEHETRLQDGEVNLVGGILEDSETNSLGGYPWLARIPILGYLFGQSNKDHSQNEIVFAITPHIVRADEITDENLRPIDVGTGTTIGLRYKEPRKASTGDSSLAPEAPLSPNGTTQPRGVTSPSSTLPKVSKP
ncbi:MAG TPA: type II and III secretion system protein [Candidatus Saccharimonadales bacterium]|nr:type II and III secretion system protein [Candidatus Saccharimonadales bacterium]